MFKYYSLWVTRMPCPPGDPPYSQVYGESWWHMGDLYITHAHMLQIAALLKRHAGEFWGIRVFEGKDLGKLIWQWGLSDGAQR